MTMYEFDNGAVVLDITDGEYRILRDGVEVKRFLDAEQRSNPMLAVSDYIGYIHDYLRHRAKNYLRSKEHNQITGCTLKDGECAKCIASGRSNEGTRCLFGAGFTDATPGRANHGKDNSN